MAKPSDVHVGKDGWMFWLSSAGHRATFYRHAYTTRPRALRMLWGWRQRIAERARRSRALGARFVQVFAPDKLSVYADMTAMPLVDPRKGAAARLARLGPHVLDLVAPLRAARARGETYLKTDTHWSPHGYRTACRAICAGLGAPAPAHVAEAPDGPSAPELHDLGVVFSPPVEEPTPRFDFPHRARRTDANALVRLREGLHGNAWVPGLMVGSRIAFANADPAADPRRVVLFGDSYAFHPTGLAAMLAEAFVEVHALWSGSIDWALIERVRPDVVIAQTAERFTFMTEPDGIDLEAFAAARVAAHDSPTAPSASA